MILMPDFLLFSLITMRMSGFIVFNPVFGRRNIPSVVKAGFIMVLSVSLFGMTKSRGLEMDLDNSLIYGFVLLKELAIGYVLGFVMELFFTITSVAGGLIDFNMGMSMSNVYDPQTNSSMPITGTIFNYMMLLIFLSVDGHLAVLKIMMQSEQIIPYTQIAFNPGVSMAILDIFKECMILAFKLSVPILAIELIGEVGVGVLMKVIPQINVFVINIQTKILLGYLVLLMLCYPMGSFISEAIDMMVRTISQVMSLM